MATLDKHQLKHDPIAEAIIHAIAVVKARMHVLGPVAIAVIVVAAAAIWFTARQRNRPSEASMALVQAQGNVAQLEAVARDYAGTFAAPAALAQLGYLAFSQTNYAAAQGYYRRLVDSHPDSFLVPAANLAIAQCYVAEGRFTDAADLLKRDVLYSADTYAALQGQLELIRVLMLQDDYQATWQELQKWDQMSANTSFGNLGDGLREQLLRETGMGTAMVVRAETQTEIQ